MRKIKHHPLRFFSMKLAHAFGLWTCFLLMASAAHAQIPSVFSYPVKVLGCTNRISPQSSTYLDIMLPCSSYLTTTSTVTFNGVDGFGNSAAFAGCIVIDGNTFCGTSSGGPWTTSGNTIVESTPTYNVSISSTVAITGSTGGVSLTLGGNLFFNQTSTISMGGNHTLSVYASRIQFTPYLQTAPIVPLIDIESEGAYPTGEPQMLFLGNYICPNTSDLWSSFCGAFDAHYPSSPSSDYFAFTGEPVRFGTTAPVSMLGTLGVSGVSSLSTATVHGSLTVLAPSSATFAGAAMKINSVPYTWPSSQGSASTVLTNNGSGALSWAAGGGSQTPWTSDINGGGYSLTNVNDVTATNGSFGTTYTPSIIDDTDSQIWAENTGDGVMTSAVIMGDPNSRVNNLTIDIDQFNGISLEAGGLGISLDGVTTVGSSVLVNSNHNSLVNYFGVYDQTGNLALQVNNGDPNAYGDLVQIGNSTNLGYLAVGDGSVNSAGGIATFSGTNADPYTDFLWVDNHSSDPAVQAGINIYSGTGWQSGDGIGVNFVVTQLSTEWFGGIPGAYISTVEDVNGYTPAMGLGFNGSSPIIFLPDSNSGQFGAVVFSGSLNAAHLPNGTLISPPAGLNVGDIWMDTTTSSQYPTLRIRKT